jgi:hypothetical protein
MLLSDEVPVFAHWLPQFHCDRSPVSKSPLIKIDPVPVGVPAGAVTIAVGLDIAEADPAVFAAVTVTRIV